MSDPSSANDWFLVAMERASDAEAMIPARFASVGPIYVAGYVVECSLKAYLMANQISWTKGRSGHNLKNLWKASGFKLADLNDTDGSKAFFIHCWSVDLRYEQQCPNGYSPTSLLTGARSLSSWILLKTKRGRR